MCAVLVVPYFWLWSCPCVFEKSVLGENSGSGGYITNSGPFMVCPGQAYVMAFLF